MYGITDVMPIQFKIFIITNHTLQFDADRGMERRTNIMQLDSEFLEEQENDDYENRKFRKNPELAFLFQTQYKHAFLDLLYDAAYDFVTNKKLPPFPEEWKLVSKDTTTQNNKFAEFFDKHFEAKEVGCITKHEFESRCENYPEFRKGNVNLKDELKKMRITFRYDKDKRMKDSQNQTQKGVFYGFCLRKIEESEEGVEEETSETEETKEFM